jgi:hypothetical protein
MAMQRNASEVTVEPLEHLKDPLGVLRSDAHAVVARGKASAALFAPGGDINARQRLATKLEHIRRGSVRSYGTM